MLRTSFVTIAAAVLSASTAIAQSAPPTQPLGCEDAAVRISINSLPRVGAAQWNDWVTLTGCGTRGATIIASALRSDGIRGETEMTRLDHLTNLLDGWFQPSLISAYQSLLKTPDASYAIRLRSMWLLSGLYSPNVDVAGPLQGYMSKGCESYDRMTSLRDAPASLPASAYDQARDTIAFAANDRNTPEYVRATAHCWEGVVNSAANYSADGGARREEPAQPVQNQTVIVEPAVQTTVVVERPVRVVYECDNRFIIYNDVGYDLAVRYGGYGSNGVLRVAHGGPYVWAAARFGPIHFWVGDEEVWYSDVSYRPCGRTRVIYAPVVRPWIGWHIGLGAYFGPRYFANRPYYVPPRGRPVIVVPRRGNENDRGGDNRGRGGDNRGGDNRGRNEHQDGGTAAPRGQAGNDIPRRAEPRGQAQGPARSQGSAPIGRPTDRAERIAAPKGADHGGDHGGDRGGDRGRDSGKGKSGR